MGFLPAGYKVPKSKSAGCYTRFEEGKATVFRVLGDAIVGWEWWTQEDKVFRSLEYPKSTPNIKTDRDPKPFIAFVCWNYGTNRVEVCSLTQRSVMDEIQAKSTHERFGHPNGYDIEVLRTGKGLETKYLVTCYPPEPFKTSLLGDSDYTAVDLQALYSGSDPFARFGNDGGQQFTLSNHDRLDAVRQQAGLDTEEYKEKVRNFIMDKGWAVKKPSDMTEEQVQELIGFLAPKPAAPVKEAVAVGASASKAAAPEEDEIPF